MPEFAQALRQSLPEGFDLPPEIWTLIDWLESHGQTMRYRSGDRLFLPIMPAKSLDDLWSNLAFVIETDLIRYWLGKDGFGDVLVPIVRCGSDGSHLAAWNTGGQMRFVLLGSEGEALTVAENAVDFITLITMGYTDIMGRQELEITPAENFADSYDGKWPEPVELKAFSQQSFDVTYPNTAASLLSDDEPDPFAEFVADIVANG